MFIKRVCAWCGCSLPPKECESVPHQSIKEPISHTICAACFDKAMDDILSAPAENHNPKK